MIIRRGSRLDVNGRIFQFKNQISNRNLQIGIYDYQKTSWQNQTTLQTALRAF